jgi:para-nitrobenzyl esterase
MKKLQGLARFGMALGMMTTFAGTRAMAADEVRIETGVVSGTTVETPGVRVFRGIPFAAPPVGDLRWKAPQPAAKWEGVRKSDEFGPRCTQASVYSDMIFRDKKDKPMSEDCLYLNVWTPAKSDRENRPVMVWFYGGGFQAGSSSEPRYDGENFAKKGIIVVSVNYRLGIFGFYAHPDLSKESGHNASGNYGLMDQIAGLEWVKKNIGAFGGDPHKVTIAGESAGSLSVSALMASPLTKGMFRSAIGESGAFFNAAGGGLGMSSLAEMEKNGVKFGESTGAKSLAEMRAKSAEELLAAVQKDKGARFWPGVDGYVLPEKVSDIFAKGKQAHVPLLAGWNAEEASFGVALAKEKTTPETFTAQVQKQFGAKAPDVLKLYSAKTDEEARRAAIDLASDLFIVYSTWEWLDSQYKTGEAPVYRYVFTRTPPASDATKIDGVSSALFGARHACELEYVFGALKSQPNPWEETDFKVSDAMASYWANFTRTGDPNGKALPEWPAYKKEAKYPVMHLGAEIVAAPEVHRDRYEYWRQ